MLGRCDRFAHEVNAQLESIVKAGQLGVLREGLPQRRGFVGGQFAQEQRGEAGFEFFAGRLRRIGRHGTSPVRASSAAMALSA